ncbi:hypothetical protein lerEdw1_009972 [Lerista edwardsae]|nr:hypothetical protein lerEdw1_009972 [Lerista edwardsae]
MPPRAPASVPPRWASACSAAPGDRLPHGSALGRKTLVAAAAELAETATTRPSRVSSTLFLWLRGPCRGMAGLVRLLVSEAQRMLSRLWKVEREAEAPSFFLEAPRTEKLLERGEVAGLHYGLGSMQGWRAHMEDAHTARLRLPGALAGWAFFAVYDGHAGSTVARFCAQHLLEHLLAAEAFAGPEEDPEAVKEGVREAFLAIDRRMQALSRAEAWERAGSTAVAVLVSPRRLYFVNLGDSRALLCRAATVAFCTEDHKPSRPAERQRIEDAGGTVLLERVNGSLAVSRALGDFDYKAVAWRGPTEQLVSPEPEVHELPRCPATDEFLVLACDGAWDAFDNAGLCAFVRARLSLTGDPQDACECVLDAALYKGSRDNMTCIVVCFPAAPEVSQEALQKERELDAHLENRVAEIYEELLQQDRGPSLVGVFQCLAVEANPNLPPGGGLASKRAVVMEAYERVRQSHEEQQQQLVRDAPPSRWNRRLSAWEQRGFSSAAPTLVHSSASASPKIPLLKSVAVLMATLHLFPQKPKAGLEHLLFSALGLEPRPKSSCSQEGAQRTTCFVAFARTLQGVLSLWPCSSEPEQQTMGKVTEMAVPPVPSERLPLLCQAVPSTTYLSQEEVVHQASAAPWLGLRRALLCLLGGLFVSMLAAAVVLLLTMPRLHAPLAWWQKSAFYHLPAAHFPDSNSDGPGDLEGVRQQLGQLLALPVQALVLGPVLEADGANLTRLCPAYGSLEQLRGLVDEGHEKGIRILLELPAWEEELGPGAEDNRTAGPLGGALRFWQEQGVDGFMVATDPAWRLNAVRRPSPRADMGRTGQIRMAGEGASQGPSLTPPLSSHLSFPQHLSCPSP